MQMEVYCKGLLKAQQTITGAQTDVEFRKVRTFNRLGFEMPIGPSELRIEVATSSLL